MGSSGVGSGVGAGSGAGAAGSDVGAGSGFGSGAAFTLFFLVNSYDVLTAAWTWARIPSIFVVANASALLGFVGSRPVSFAIARIAENSRLKFLLPLVVPRTSLTISPTRSWIASGHCSSSAAGGIPTLCSSGCFPGLASIF